MLYSNGILAVLVLSGAAAVLHPGAANASEELPASPADIGVIGDLGDDDLARFLLVPVFDILDCTNQGFIEAGEVDEHFPVLFNHFDKDLDRSLERKEYVRSRDAGQARLEARMFDDMDTNSDDRVSAREYRAQVIHLIAAVDYDGDGEVTPEELARDLDLKADLKADSKADLNAEDAE